MISKNSLSNFTPSKVDEVAREIKSAMDAIASKHGINIKVGRISWNANSFRTRIDATTNTGEKQMFVSAGFSDNVLHKTFVFKNKTFEVIGFNPNKPKYAISGRRIEDGKIYNFTLRTVKHLLDVSAGKFGG